MSKALIYYSTDHQKCLQHDCRHLTSSEENKPGLEWNRNMHELVWEILHYRNGLRAEEGLDP